MERERGRAGGLGEVMAKRCRRQCSGTGEGGAPWVREGPPGGVPGCARKGWGRVQNGGRTVGKESLV